MEAMESRPGLPDRGGEAMLALKGRGQSGGSFQGGDVMQSWIARSAPRIVPVLLIGCLAWASAAMAQDKRFAVTVELGDVSLTKMPFVLAAEAGIYEKNGLDVTQFITPSAAAAVKGSGVSVPPQNIKSGVIGDINIGGGSPTMVRMTSSAIAPQRVILATTDDVSRFHIITRPDISKPEDLKGKRIGYGSLGALDHYSMMLFAEKMGWDPLRDISVFSSGNGPMPTLKGKVDAFFGTDIALEESKKLGLKDLLDLYQFRFAMPGSGVNAETGWLAKNREAAARFIKATVEAIAMLKTDKEAAFAAMTKWYGITDRAKQEAVLTQARDLPSKPYPSVEGLKKMQAVYNWREMTRHKLEDFYDASFVAALDKSGYIDGLYKTAAH
jgi:NitT/TauT family transport system substrate-binding protein